MILTPEKACWVSLPPPLIGRLLDGGAPMPLALDVSVVASEEGPDSSSPAQRFCVAWGGGATPGGAAPFLGVPAAFASLLKLKEGATVDVRPLLLKGANNDNDGASSSSTSSSSSSLAQPPPRATRVHVTPASADDWEVISAQAGLLEESITLQVGLVSVGAPFPVFVPRAGGGGAPVLLVATEIEPGGFPVAFLGPGCEFVVAPVARRGEREGEEGKGGTKGDDDSKSEEAPVVSWLRVLPSAAARAASLAGARFAASPRAPLPLLLAETASMPAGKRLATVPSTTAWAPASAVQGLSSSSSSQSSPLVVVALSSDLGNRSPRLFLALRACCPDDEGGESPFPLPAGHLSLPPPAARSAGLSPGKRAVLRRCSPSLALSSPGDAGLPSLVIMRPDRGAVERRSGGDHGHGGGEQQRRRQGEEQPQPPPPHPVLSALSAAGPAELAALFSAWVAAQAVAGSSAGGGGEEKESPAVVVCDGALVRLMLVDDGGEEPASSLSFSASEPPYLDFAIEFRWPRGSRRPGSPVLLSAESALRVELGGSAEMMPPPPSESSSPSSWPDSEPPPPFGSRWTREHLAALLDPLRAPLDSRARALLRAAGARPATGAGGVVVVGGRNGGKSALAAAVAREFAGDPVCCASTVRVACRDLVACAEGGGGAGGGGGEEGVVGGPASARAALAAALRLAADSAPSLLVLDDVDALGSPGGIEDEGNGGESGSPGSALASWLARSLRSLLLPSPAAAGSSSPLLLPPPIALLATATDASAVPSCLRAPGLLVKSHLLPPLGPRERRAVLRRALASRGVRASAAGVSLAAAEAAEGCDAADVSALAERAIHAAVTRRLASAARGGKAGGRGGGFGMSFGSGGAPPKVSSSGSANSSSASFAAAAAAASPPGDGGGKKKKKGAFSTSSPLSVMPSSLPVPGAGAVRVCRCDFEEAARGFSPAAAWAAGSSVGGGGDNGDASSSSSLPRGWEDVGGMDAAREALTEALSLPLAAARLVASGKGGEKGKGKGKKKMTSSSSSSSPSSSSSAPPLRLRTGVLLFGPPGCGKTHAARAAVAAAGARCITVKGPELLNKYIGASEAAVRAVFSRARAAAPCVLFFDEFDSLAPSRGADSTGVTDRVVNALLTEIDGAEGLEGVVVVAASSRPDLVDAALLRPGRLDRLVYCGPPSGLEERRAVLSAAARRLVLSGEAEEKDEKNSAPLLLLDELAERTEGFSGADLGALLSEAALLAAREAVEEAEERRKARAKKRKEEEEEEEEEGKEEGSDDEEEEGIDLPSSISLGPPPITRAHLLAALAAARPSLPRAELAALEEKYAAFRGTPRRREPPGEPAKGAHDPGDASKAGSRVTLK